MDFTTTDRSIIEKMIQVSKQKPLLPEQFIPWSYQDKGDEAFLPDKLISLNGLGEFEELSQVQKQELGRRELTQVMYAYAWSETVACAFFNRRLLKADHNSIEYQFLLRETIEEYRHQAMFSDIIQRIKGEPIAISRLHRWVALLTVKFAPDAILYLSVLAIEQATDVYGDVIRQDESIHPIVRKVALLHHIEEARHIHFAKLWLKQYTENAGLLLRTVYAAIVIMNLYFMRTMYVRQEIFDDLKVNKSKEWYKKARKNLAIKFGVLCTPETREYISSFNGWNNFTRFLAKKLLKIQGV